jgi:tryptophan synthase alpha chain
MTTAKPLRSAITRASQEKGRPALIPFLTAGVPSPETFWDTLEELCRCGADALEIGVPFSDPVADGPVVASASQKALESGIGLGWILEGLRARELPVPAVLMSYANPLLQRHFPPTPCRDVRSALRESLSALSGEMAQAGVSGLIVPDLPLEEDGPWREAFGRSGIDLIALVGPNTSRERMEAYAGKAGGYVYVVSVLGTTGVREGLPAEAGKTLALAREVFDLPLALGFGVREPGQLDGLNPKPEAVIFGSSLIRHLESGGKVSDFMAPWLA